MRPWLFAVATAGLFVFPSVSFAKGIMLITRGTAFSHLGDVESKKRTAEMPSGVSVGYKYSYVGVFWLDLWRYDGQYCLYREKEYFPLSKLDAATLMGVSERDVGEPFFYHVPPRLLIVGALVLVGIVTEVANQARKNRVFKLVHDPLYSKALSAFHEQATQNDEAKRLAAEKNEPAPTALPDPYEAAIATLVYGGVERKEAEENFRQVLVHALNASQQQAT